MKKQSLWLDTTSTPKFPKLSGRVDVDALVVGAGITGITTAYLLKEAGLTVAVVDQQDVGGGETGHTTAHLTYVTDTRLSELVKMHGRDAAQACWDSGMLALKEIKRLAGREDIDCSLRAVPAFLVAAQDDESENLRAEAKLADELGFDAEFVAADPLLGRAAVRFANQYRFHPLRYLFPLAQTLPGAGSHVFRHTCGSNIDAEKHELHADGGVIGYRTLIAATHVPIQGERGTFGAALFQTKIAGYSTYAIEASVDDAPDALFWDTNDPYLYLRTQPAKEGVHVIIGGEDHKTGQEADTDACYARLAARLKEIFPHARPERRWSGQVWESPDGLPYIGEVGENQFAATGFGGNGITFGTCAAMLLRDLITKKPYACAVLYSPQRKVLHGAGRYLRENADFPARFVADHLRPAETDLHRCQGAIVRVDGKKSAVYLDEHGKRTVLSPVCPHMGCIVAWNPAEKTWDCPCHGSRFLPTGELMAGPAEAGLERR